MNTTFSTMRRAWRCAMLALCSAVLLSACGGGGSKGGTAKAAEGSDDGHGALSLGISGGAYRDVNHVWITVASVALHAQASQPWSSSDTTWKVLKLSTPVVIDLAVVPTSSQGDVTRILNGLSVPVGSYGQIRLFPLAHDAALDDAAATQGLSYNAQVNYTDGNGVARVVPLELSQPDQGWRVAGSFDVAANSASYVVVQNDLLQGLVRSTSSDGVDRFLMKPTLIAYDMTASGAIIGSLDPALICGGTSAPAAPNCAQDIVVSAQRLSGDGTRHDSVRQYRVTSSTGGFALYPLPTGSSYDVVITGRHMQTMVIRGVTVAPFSAIDTLEWTSLGSSTSPIQPVIRPTASRTVNLASALSPSSALLWAGQTLGSGTVPYLVARMQVDVGSGLLARALDLPEGPVSVADFVASEQALSFVDVTPQEGSQAFTVQALGTVYDDAGAASVVTPPAGSATTISVAAPARKAALSSGQILVNVSGSLSSGYDHALVIVSDVNGVVSTQAVTSAGSVVMTVPAGTQAAALGGTAVYSVALRAHGATGGLRWVRAASAVDLRSAVSGAVSLSLP